MGNTDDLRKFTTQESYKRRHGAGFEVLPMCGDDISDLLTLAVDTARTQGITRYENSERGLQAFMERSVQYLEYIKRQNEVADSEDSARIIPSIESWSVFMGLARMTILTYEKQRNDDWKAFIAWMKNVIQSARSQLTDKSKIPVLAYIFSSVNSLAGYANTSEIKLNPIPEKEVVTSSESADVIASRYQSRLADNQQENDEKQ